MAENTIQGTNAIVYIFINDWVEYVCSTDVSVTVTASLVPTRTIGDGYWQKNAYSDLSYSISLNGIMKFITDETAFTGFDMIANQLNFTEIQFRISFSDDAGNVKSIQGFSLVDSLQLAFNPSTLLNSTITLTGNGALMYYDGLIACATSVTSISQTTALDGSIWNTTFLYTYTGGVYQVKYRIDNQGAYGYALSGASIIVPGLTIGSHSIEIIPICPNGYLGLGLVFGFNITHNLTCSLVVTGITITGTGPATASVAFNSDPSSSILQYSIDGGSFVNYGSVPTNPTIISIPTLTAGAHTITAQPVCANGVIGTGATQPFTITTAPTQSIIEWSYNTDDPGTTFIIYKNSVPIVSQSTSGGFGNFSASSSDTIRSVLSTSYSSSRGPVSGLMVTKDVSTNVTLNSQGYNVSSGSPFASVNYSFVPINGDTYSITANG